MKARWYELLLRSPDGVDSSASSSQGDSTSSSVPDPSGGNDSPSPTQDGSVASPSPVDTSGGDFHLDIHDDDDENFDLSGITETEVVQTPQAPVVETPTPAVVTPPAPVEAATQTPAEGTTPSQEDIQPFATDPGKFLTKLAEHREALIDALAKEKFALTEEEVLAYEDNPTEALSRMGAKLYYDAITATMARMAELVPRMILEYNTATTQASSKEDFFFSKWPQLDREKHREDVIRIGKAYRQANPKASAEQFANDVGMMVSVSLGLGNTPGQGGKKPAPQSNSGFKPALGGGGGMGNGSQQTQGQDPWSGMGMDFE